MVSYKIKLYGSDLEDYTASFGWLKQQLGICSLQSSINRLWNRIDEIENEIVEILKPQAKKILLEKFAHKDFNSREINSFMFDSYSRLKRYAFHLVFEELKEQKILLSVSQGRGRPRKWFLNKELKE